MCVCVCVITIHAQYASGVCVGVCASSHMYPHEYTDFGASRICHTKAHKRSSKPFCVRRVSRHKTSSCFAFNVEPLYLFLHQICVYSLEEKHHAVSSEQRLQSRSQYMYLSTKSLSRNIFQNSAETLNIQIQNKKRSLGHMQLRRLKLTTHS